MQAGRTTVCKICNHRTNYNFEPPQVAQTLNKELDLAVGLTVPEPIEIVESEIQPQSYAQALKAKKQPIPWNRTGEH